MNMQSLLGNFALILFILMVVTGVIWFYDKLVLAKKRRAAAEMALAAFDERNAKLKAQGIAVDESGRATERKTAETSGMGGVFRQLLSGHCRGIFHSLVFVGTFPHSFEFDGADASDR